MSHTEEYYISPAEAFYRTLFDLINGNSGEVYAAGLDRIMQDAGVDSNYNHAIMVCIPQEMADNEE